MRALDRGCLALGVAPFVATLAWYVSTLTWILLVDRRLDSGADVATLGIGALLFGLPLATLLTVTLAAPIYRLLEARGRLSAAAALGTGALCGLLLSLALRWLEGGYTSTLPLWQGLLVGVVTAAVWWKSAGRGAGSPSDGN